VNTRKVSRVIRDSESGTELIVKTDPYATIREVLEEDWPFKKKKSKDWYLVDEKGNDVTDWPISNWDGIAEIRFSDY